MLWLYKLIIYLLYCLLYPYGKLKALNGSPIWQGRLGYVKVSGANHIWLHASSVGEVKVIGYLIDYLTKRNPVLNIHVTTMTEAGYNMASKLFSTDKISLSYFPFDTPSTVKRTLKAIDPQMLIIAETEIWPNLIGEASKNNILIVLINGRMSKKAFGKYKLFRLTFKKLLSNYERFFFKTVEDSQRYIFFDINPSKWIIAGDMKFDAPLLERTNIRVLQIRARIGIEDNCFLFVAGSTRPAEETIIIEIFKELTLEGKNITMVIAPRHIERVNEIKSLLDDKKIQFRFYNPGDVSKREKMILVDKLGVLNELYLAADLSFVGGTLVDIGGHNILEPVWAGCPVLFGPSLHNVEESADYIIKNNYGAMVKSRKELLSVLKKVASGDIIFSTKEANDLDNSPTALIGDYILKKLKDV